MPNSSFANPGSSRSYGQDWSTIYVREMVVMRPDPHPGNRTGSLHIDHDGGLCTVRLDREAHRNTIDVATCLELSELLREVDSSRTIRCVLVTGTGNYFCTGGDVVSDPALDGEPPNPLDYRWLGLPFQELFRALWELETPVVSAVNGSVAGIGWMLALLADLTVADPSARWGHSFVQRGLIPHAGDPFFLPRIIPFHRLNEVALLGEVLTSADLHSWGLINRLAGAEDMLAVATDIGQRLANGPTRSIGLTKRLYRRSLVSDMATSFAEERAASALLLSTVDRQEGLESFVERRAPRFIGR